MKRFVLTNNSLVQERLASRTVVVFKPGGIRDILGEAALYIADGHRLLTHPLSGSVKPGETPYKSMIIGGDASSAVDLESSKLISHALEACDKFDDRTGLYSEQTLRDLQVVDCSLIEGALDSACK